MTRPLTVECTVRFDRTAHGRKQVRTDPEPELPAPGRITRVTKLMALAIRFEQLIESGEVKDYADLARLTRVSRARITQIMNLRLLAPDIQVAIIDMPRVESGHDVITMRDLQRIALVADWTKQRRHWNELGVQVADTADTKLT